MQRRRVAQGFAYGRTGASAVGIGTGGIQSPAHEVCLRLNAANVPVEFDKELTVVMSGRSYWWHRGSASPRGVMRGVLVASTLGIATAHCFGAANLAPSASAIFGASSALVGGIDYPIVNQGSLAELNDGVSITDAALLGVQGAFTINANGAAGQNGNGADTYAGGATANQFDYVGVLFAEPAYGVTSVRVQHYLANDGGWWGPYSGQPTSASLSASDLAAPQVQITRDGGATWSNVATASSDYVSKYTGVPRGTGFPNATAGPFATLSFAEQNDVDGIRLIQNGAGNVDSGPGFIGVTEFEVYGIPQELKLIVNTSTGSVSVANAVQSDISFDFYSVASASGSLNVAGWNSLQNPAANPSGFPAGNGSGNGWETLGMPKNSAVAEAYLTGWSSLASGGTSLNLGTLFAAGGAHDLKFRYRTASGRFVDVSDIEYVSSPVLAGDYDGNGAVDAADYVVWRKNLNHSVFVYNDITPGTVTESDYPVWRANFGASNLRTASSRLAALAPEPNGAVLLLGPAYFVVLAPRGALFCGARS